MKKFLLFSGTLAGLVLLPVLLHAQGTRSGQADSAKGTSYLVSGAVAAGPTPRLHDGKPDLSGIWDGCWKTGPAGCFGGGTNNAMEQDLEMKPGELDALLQPWARQLWHSRKEKDEPYVGCLPMGVPRINPYGSRIVQSYTGKGMSNIYILHENGDSGTHRQIFMDGRRHPDERDLIHTWFGHSIGWWDGDALVVDTVGYNDKFWLDGTGVPHTEQMHTIERYTRPNYGRLILDFTLDDPGTFTKPIQHRFEFKAERPDIDLLEFICLEDNEYGIAGGFTPADESGEKEKAKQQAEPRK
jgi:hypothetical protein